MTEPVSFYTIVFASATYHSYRNAEKGTVEHDEASRLSYQAQALKLMIDAIKKSNGYASDELLLSVVTLAAHGGSRSVQSMEFKQNNLPWANLPNVDYYGSMQCELAHLQALYFLVHRRGGLQNIKLSGLANAIALYVSQLTLYTQHLA